MSTTHKVTDEQIDECLEQFSFRPTPRVMLKDILQWIHSNLSPEDIWDTDYLLEKMIEDHKHELCRLIAAECSVDEVFHPDVILEWVGDE